MRTVHRLTPLSEEACGWRPAIRAPPAVAAAPPAAAAGREGRILLQRQHSLLAEPSDPTPLLFALEDIPSPALQRSGSFVAPGVGGPGPAAQTKSTIETLQLLLGPASQAEEMLHMHVKLAHELAASRDSSPAQSHHSSMDGGSYSGASGPDTPPDSQHGSPTTVPTASAAATAGVPREALRLLEVFRRLRYAPKLKCSTLRIAQRRGLQHYYLTVQLPDGTPEGGGTFIVDSSFKEAFVVSSPTPRYAEVLASLEPYVAATKGCLRQAVVLLCAEMAQCFAERGLSIPPWRTASALLARWCLA